MTKLNRLILEHIAAGAPYMTPEPGLFSQLRQLVRPVATEEQWTDAIYFLLQKEFIGFERDAFTDEKKFFIREAGRAALRDA